MTSAPTPPRASTLPASLARAHDLYRALCTSRGGRDAAGRSVEKLRVALANVVAHPDEDRFRTLRLNNRTVREHFVEAPGAESYLADVGFRRVHLVSESDGLNEQVLRFSGESATLVEDAAALGLLDDALRRGESHLAVADAIDDEFVGYPLELPIHLRVRLPDGSELEGRFAGEDTVMALRQWVAALRRDAGRTRALPELGLQIDREPASSLLAEDDATLESLGVTRETLLVKRAGTLEDTRAMADAVEAKHREDLVRARREQERRARERAAARKAEKIALEKKRLDTIAAFREDRGDAERAAQRAIREAARASASALGPRHPPGASGPGSASGSASESAALVPSPGDASKSPKGAGSS